MLEKVNKRLFDKSFTCNYIQDRIIYKSCDKLKSFKINNIFDKAKYQKLWVQNRLIFEDYKNDLVYYCERCQDVC